MTYADLYRETKIQETVYELLTEQYEMAKVQEAKEIPVVKVLDVAMVPSKKSYPPRTEMTVLGTLFGIALMMAWLVIRTKWEAVEANDPRKAFATEVFSTVQARISKFSGNGIGVESNGRRPWTFWKGAKRAIKETQDEAGDPM